MVGPFNAPCSSPAPAAQAQLAPTPEPWRVVLADRYQMVRAAIGVLLSSMPRLEVVAEARNGAELLALVKDTRPDLVITEVAMPGLDPFAAIAEIHRCQPSVRMLVLSSEDTGAAVRNSMASGACGYLSKQSPLFELEQAIVSVMTRGYYYSARAAQRLLESAEPTAQETLTPSQVEVLRLIAGGRSSRQIADQLSLSPKTVDVHRGRIMARLDLKDVASLTRYALRKGLLPPCAGAAVAAGPPVSDRRTHQPAP